MKIKIVEGNIEWTIEFEKGSKFKDRFGNKYEIAGTNPWKLVNIGGKYSEEIKDISKEEFFKKLFKDWKEGVGKFTGFSFFYKQKE